MELFPPRMRKLWNDWELHVLVLLSSMLQIVLFFMGNRRKYTSRNLIRIVLWCAYLMADSVATVTLGVIASNLGDIRNESIGKEGYLNAGTEITAFWAPFLLLHLGGPDTITAYSLEDNELWLRHLLGLGVQTGVAFHVFLLSQTGSWLSILSILMFCAGIIKCGERTWALRSASNEQFKNSMLTPPPDVSYSNLTREYTLRKCEGFDVQILETEGRMDFHFYFENIPCSSANELVAAYRLFQNFKRLFVDLALEFDDWYNSLSFLKEVSSSKDLISFDKAFKVIEIELGFLYDVLYTKATLLHSLHGWVLRLITLSSTFVVLVVFLMIDKHKYSNIDLAFTFLLLSVAILLEVYGILLLLSSDWTDLWLSERRKSTSTTFIHQAITRLQLPKHPRWSNSISQFSLLSFSLKDKDKDKHMPLYGIQKHLVRIDEVLEKHWYTTHEKVSEHLSELIFEHLKMKHDQVFSVETNNMAEEIKKLLCFQAADHLDAYECKRLEWSVKVDFDQSILIWHIATDLCYHSESHLDTTSPTCIVSQWLSQYMMYLLVVRRSISSGWIGMIRFRDTCAEVTKFLQERKSESAGRPSDWFQKVSSWAMDCFQTGKSTLDKSEACKKLLQMNSAVPRTLEHRGKSMLLDACKLASELQAISDKNQKWEMIGKVWMEMLTYAASQSRGNFHAQQLRRGGEFLTHVWLLMAHLGLTEQLQSKAQGQKRVHLFFD